MLDKNDFIQINIKENNGNIVTFYMTHRLCIIPGINIYYIPKVNFDKMKSLFPEDTEDVVYEESMNDAIYEAANGKFNHLIMTIYTTGIRPNVVLEGGDDANLLHKRLV